VPEKRYDIFLSYSREDIEFAVRLHKALETAGLKAWRDERINPGESIPDKIQRALRASRNFAVLLSKSALASTWVTKERDTAEMLGLHIVPLLLERLGDDEIPPFLRKRRWLDFSDHAQLDEKRFGEKTGELVRSLAQSTSASLKSARRQLHEIMHDATQSLLVCGLSLDKFTMNNKVQLALQELFSREIPVTLILLNPYCRYAHAHEEFHHLESNSSSARSQIENSIHQLEILLRLAHPKKFSVYLSQYMPRLRTAIVDSSLCYLNLYMYGIDVSETPEFVLRAGGDSTTSRYFRSVVESVHRLLKSPYVFPLIADGWFDREWRSSRVGYYLSHCVERLCLRDGDRVIENHLFGYQNDGPVQDLCTRTYLPGSLSAGEYLRIKSGSASGARGGPGKPGLDKFIEERLEYFKSQHPEMASWVDLPTLTEKATYVLTAAHHSRVLWNTMYAEDCEDVVDRLLSSLILGHPEPSFADSDGIATMVTRGMELLSRFDDRRQPDRKDWLLLSIAAELLSEEDLSKKSLAELEAGLWDFAHDESRVDASEFFFHVLDTNFDSTMRLVCIPSTTLASLFTLKFYEVFLRGRSPQTLDTVQLYLIPRSVTSGDYASYRQVRDQLSFFPWLEGLPGFHLIQDGPKRRAINLQRIARGVSELIESAFLLDVRGSYGYRSLQGVKKTTFFGFVAKDQVDDALVGSEKPERRLVFVHQQPGDTSFCLKCEDAANLGGEATRIEAKLLDQEKRWVGGPIATIAQWKRERRERFEMLRRFYSSPVAVFDNTFGTPDTVEPEVKFFLEEFSSCKRILVLGCGCGKEVVTLWDLAPAATVVGIDFFSEPILRARERQRQKESFLVADYYALGYIFDGEFDGIVANAVLVHLLEKDDLHRILDEIRKKLRSAGLLFLRVLSKEGKEEGKESDPQLPHLPRWFVYFNEPKIRHAAKEARLTLVRHQKNAHPVFPGLYWESVLLQKPPLPSIVGDGVQQSRKDNAG
jgi:SAM-dependent methyltransferase